MVMRQVKRVLEGTVRTFAERANMERDVRGDFQPIREEIMNMPSMRRKSKQLNKNRNFRFIFMGEGKRRQPNKWIRHKLLYILDKY